MKKNIFIFFLILCYIEQGFAQDINIGTNYPINNIPFYNIDKGMILYYKQPNFPCNGDSYFIPYIDLATKHKCSQKKCRAFVEGRVYYHSESLNEFKTNVIDSIKINSVILSNEHGVYYKETKDGTEGKLEKNHSPLFLRMIKLNYLIRMKYSVIISNKEGHSFGWTEIYHLD